MEPFLKECEKCISLEQLFQIYFAKVQAVDVERFERRWGAS